MAKPTRDEVTDWAKKQNLDVDNFIDELDQYKTAHDKLTAGLKEAVAESIKYKRERDSLIKDIDNIYKKSEVFAQEYVKMQDKNFHDGLKIDTLKDDNSRLNRQIKLVYKMAENYLRLKEHIRDKANNNPGNSRYIALVHFVDEIEGAD
ncbi:hypothetical protein [Mammaliicoccus sciuri]|uniref:hypothetical protein n=1 Tax=Mammaliicoccus sciuri TaxID=1296 RepID=UPI00194FA309|nr:hypothetical protein [Mammaliicoccus sciuri]